MPLIVCPECKHKISSYADKCIFCGCPMSVINKLLKAKEDKHKKTKKEPKQKKEKAKKEDKPKVRPESFINSRSKDDRLLIAMFTSLINDRISNLSIKDSSYMYSYKVAEADGVVTPNTLCWFTSDDSEKLCFKYYSNPLKREGQISKRIYSSESIKKCADIAFGIYESVYAPFKKTNESEELEDLDELESIFESDDNENINENLELYSHIIEAIAEKRIKADEAIVSLCKDVAAFVINETMQNAIRQRDFKNAEEFNRYKYAHRYIANFFGYSFSFRHLKEDDAKVFYLYYKASLLVNIIKRYETLYHKTIIDDYIALINSLVEMIKYDELDYSRAKGLLSTFNVVPTGLLDHELERLHKIEK